MYVRAVAGVPRGLAPPRLGRMYVSVSLQELRRTNLISGTQRQVEILDGDALCTLAQFDATCLI